MVKVQSISGVVSLKPGAASEVIIPAPLCGPLFGDTQSNPTDRFADAPTYALLEAGRIEGLQERLAGSGLEHTCLFKGDLERTAGIVAPWLVRITKDGNFTRGLFTQGAAIWQLWDAYAYVLLRGFVSLAELASHLRRFLYVPNSRGYRYYLSLSQPVTWDGIAGSDEPFADELVANLRIAYMSTQHLAPDTFVIVEREGNLV